MRQKCVGIDGGVQWGRIRFWCDAIVRCNDEKFCRVRDVDRWLRLRDKIGDKITDDNKTSSKKKAAAIKSPQGVVTRFTSSVSELIFCTFSHHV